MNRRKFIVSISVGAIAVLGVGVISFSGFEESVKEIVATETRRLKLRVPDKEISSFIKGARDAGLWNSLSFSDKVIIKWSYRIERLNIPILILGRYKGFKEGITKQFLFSSSFFYDGMNESKQIHYLRIYDPYTTPCCNPFSNLYY